MIWRKCSTILQTAGLALAFVWVLFGASPGTASAAWSQAPIAAGDAHALAVKPDGTVWAWGDNSSGQLGANGIGGQSPTPVQVSSIGGVMAVGAGSKHSVALKTDGTVWTWGANSGGQLGLGHTIDTGTPQQVPGLTQVLTVKAGSQFTLAVKTDGTVWAWGHNDKGQLGNGTVSDSSSPVQVPGLTDIKDIAAGDSHVLALKRDGTVWAWGGNDEGQLGIGKTKTFEPRPVQIPKLTGVIQVAAGPDYSMAVVRSGLERNIDAWGNNDSGQLGDGTNVSESSPTLVDGSSAISDLAAGAAHAAAIREGDASLWVWGDNENGQLGDGGTLSLSRPTKLTSIDEVREVESRKGFTIAVRQDGTVWAWGTNEQGQLGLGNLASQSSPQQIPNFRLGATAPRTLDPSTRLAPVAAGFAHSLALKADGTVWAWGTDEHGELGDGNGYDDYADRIPRQVKSLTDVVQLAAGQYFSAALKKDGTVWTWGQNDNGQLGIGRGDNQTEPKRVDGLTDIVAISSGFDHTVALASDGKVWSWGANFYSQLGNSRAGDYSDRPVRVEGLADVIEVAASGVHSIALKRDGTVWAWGSNDLGALGDGTWERTRSVPVQTIGLNDVVTIAAGYNTSAALKKDGSLWMWGEGHKGQLGEGMPSQRNMPIKVLEGVKAVALADATAYALKVDGTVLAFGINDTGQIGNNRITAETVLTPVQVPGLSGIIAVKAGIEHALAVTSDCTLVGWGYNMQGQLGDGSKGQLKVSSPVTVTGLKLGKPCVKPYTLNPATPLKPIGELETPKDLQKVNGTIPVRGWFLDPEGVDDIEIVVDGDVIGTAALGDQRNDIAARYPDYKDSNSGFHYFLDTTRLKNGAHTLLIREKSAKGGTTELKEIRFTVKNQMTIKSKKRYIK